MKTLTELTHYLGAISSTDVEGTQDTLIDLVCIVQDQAQEIKVLKAEVEHLENIVHGNQESPR